MKSNLKNEVIALKSDAASLLSEDFINQQTINLQHLSTGTYLLQIKNESGIARKIVVIN